MDDIKLTKKELDSIKVEPNYCILSIGYSPIVIPQKHHKSLMEILSEAESINKDWNEEEVSIDELKDVKLRMISGKEYKRIKLANLLQCTPKEIKL